MKFISTTTFLILFSFSFLSVSKANFNQSINNNPQTTIEQDGSILLPEQHSRQIDNLISQPKFDSQIWEQFETDNDNWSVIFDKTTGTPHRAFGKPIPIEGFNLIDESNVRDAAMSFLKDYKDVLGIIPEEIKFRRATNLNQLWSVSYSQMYKGIEVLLTEIELRITSSGKVMAFGVDYYKDINLSTSPTISKTEAEGNAANGLNFKEFTSEIQSSKHLYILPVRFSGQVKHSLVYDVSIELNEPIGQYQSFVDAHSGNVVWRRNMILDTETKIQAEGGVKLSKASDPITVEQFPNQYIRYNFQKISADKSGNASIDVDLETVIEASMASQWARVIRADASMPNAAFKDTLTPGEPFKLLWDDSNSHLVERILFYHTNVAHDYYKAMDPESKALDFEMNVSILQGGSPNAGSNLQTGYITFQGSYNNNTRFSQHPGVLYHEYGHSCNMKLYKELGITNGMVNLSCHEALADLNAALMLNEPRLGLGSYKNDTNRFMRNANNNKRYPENVTADSHTTGLILSGAYWDIKKTTDLDFARWLVAFTRKMGTPDDANLQKAFMEWFIESLVTDDASTEGDNDLTNGTPHSDEIVAAFNKHGIGTSIMLAGSFKHTPLTDTDDTENPYMVNFEFSNTLEFLGPNLVSVYVHYSLNGEPDYTSVLATELGSGVFEVAIPAQKRGTVVEYYITAIDNFTQKKMTYNEFNGEIVPYQFLVGYVIAFNDALEEKNQWETSSSDDNATTGLWQHAVPSRVLFRNGAYLYEIQPNGDHSTIGTKCFVTDARTAGYQNPNIQLSYMPNGKTTLTSPKYDITKLENPLIRFYQWFTNLAFNAFPNRAAFWQIDLSGDGGETWVNFENTKANIMVWKKRQIPIEQYVQKSVDFRIRFTVLAQTGLQGVAVGSVTEALIDDFEILSANDETATGIEEKDNHKLTYIYNYPNPVTQSTTFEFYLEKTSNVELSIYDMYGNEIKKLVDGERHSGTNNAEWDRTSDNGTEIASGVYVYKLQINSNVILGKMIVSY